MAIDLANHRLFLGCWHNLMVVMDSGSGKVVTRVPIGDEVDAIAYDPATKLVFASTRDGKVTIAREETPDKLTVVQTLATAVGSKTMALDRRTHNIYLGAADSEAPAAQAPGAAKSRPKMVPGSFRVLVFATEVGK